MPAPILAIAWVLRAADALTTSALARCRAPTRSRSSSTCCAIPRPASRSCCSDAERWFLEVCLHTRRQRPAAVSRAGVRRDQEDRQDHARRHHHADDDPALRRAFRRGLLRCERPGAGAVERVRHRSSASSRRARCCARSPSSPPTGSASPRSTPPSSRSPATPPVPRVPTRPSSASTSSGATPRERSRRLWDEMIPAAGAQDQLSPDRELCRFHRRERVAGGTLQARHGAARGRSEPARRRRHAVRLASRADRAVADRKLARRDAPHAAAECLCAHDRERVRQRREPASST